MSSGTPQISTGGAQPSVLQDELEVTESTTAASEDSSVVYADEDRKLLTETKSLLKDFFKDFGILAADSSSNQNIFALIFELIHELKKNLTALKQELRGLVSENALKVFDTTMKGVDSMLKFAKDARNEAFIGVGASAAGSGVGISRSSTALKQFQGPNPNASKLQSETQMANMLGQGVGQTSGIFQAQSQHSTTEGSAATKSAEALSAFTNSLAEIMRDLVKEIDSIMNTLNQIFSGTTSAQKSFRFQG